MYSKGSFGPASERPRKVKTTEGAVTENLLVPRALLQQIDPGSKRTQQRVPLVGKKNVFERSFVRETVVSSG